MTLGVLYYSSQPSGCEVGECNFGPVEVEVLGHPQGNKEGVAGWLGLGCDGPSTGKYGHYHPHGRGDGDHGMGSRREGFHRHGGWRVAGVWGAGVWGLVQPREGGVVSGVTCL